MGRTKPVLVLAVVAVDSEGETRHSPLLCTLLGTADKCVPPGT